MDKQNQEMRDIILLSVLPHVVFEGWNRAAVKAGINDLEHIPEVDFDAYKRVFPGGMVDMAKHFSDWTDRQMVSEIDEKDLSNLKVRERIAFSVMSRLKILTPHREAVRYFLSFLSLPQNAGTGLTCSYQTVSEIWFAIGDESADFNFYTKRALLAPVLGATTLYWLADECDSDGDFPDTWAFLDRRIEDVLGLFKARVRLTKILKQINDPFSTCKRIISAIGANG